MRELVVVVPLALLVVVVLYGAKSVVVEWVPTIELTCNVDASSPIESQGRAKLGLMMTSPDRSRSVTKYGQDVLSVEDEKQP